jgi:heme/copper-type cytochrome/quinol oxidase subunit 2
MSFFRTLAMSITIILSIGATSAAEQPNPYVEFRVKTYSMQEAYLNRVAKHHAVVMQDLEDKLKQQQWQTTVVSVMVVVMVAFGVMLSALQFYADFRSNGKSSVTLKLGTGTIELNSTVIGLAILAMSFWFFQTYIDRVYTVKITHIQTIDLTRYGLNE